MTGKLVLEDGSVFEGESFSKAFESAGEVVFSTGMTGYPESLTDPSYKGQILIFTYPLIGNYGVFDKDYWESDKIQVAGLIVSEYINTPSHFNSKITLSSWLTKEKIPALQIKDTRLLAQRIRTKGTMLGKIIFNKNIPFYNPDTENLLISVSTKKINEEGNGKIKTLLIDCGAKQNIKKSLLKRNVKVTTVPWDFDPFVKNDIDFDAIIISNGPGNPKMAVKTIETIKKSLARKIPILGICLGHQLLTLAAGGDTYKLKFGHRSQNQPCMLVGSEKCYITTQNHGFAVGKIPPGFSPWFVNANDNSNEGIIHNKYPFMSVQFHPEANPGPVDCDWIFDYFLDKAAGIK